MGITGLGTAVMFALAAVLWFAYLVPTWVRRREYLATERNATRLQQTLRIMAETAEVPDEVRVEATARHAARQARLLDERRRADDARERAALAAVRRAAAPVITAAARARRRLRRARLVAAVTLLVSLVAGGVQAAVLALTGASSGGWIVLAVAGGGALLSGNVLSSLARRRVPAPASRTAASSVPTAATRAASPEVRVAATPRAWTPVAVPRPLYLDRPATQTVEPPRDAERLMREASAAAHAALRAAHREAEVVEMPTEPSRWAGMGRIDDVEPSRPDLDEVLRRRRLAG